jgi:hypothetical protein
MPQRSVNASSNSARVNNQNTTILPVDSAISGACQTETGETEPIALVTACAADPNAKTTASRPATRWRKSRNSEAANTSNKATVAARSAISRTASDIKAARSRHGIYETF